MNGSVEHIAFKPIAGLLIIGCALTILFGEGAHLHTVLDHFDDHGDARVLFHAHSDHNHTGQKDSHAENEEHQHEVSSIDIFGVLTSGSKADLITDSVPVLLSGTAVAFTLFDDQPDYLFDLPPPDQSFDQYHFLSFSLRGPPAA